jgi:hypothetical protein
VLKASNLAIAQRKAAEDFSAFLANPTSSSPNDIVKKLSPLGSKEKEINATNSIKAILDTKNFSEWVSNPEVLPILSNHCWLGIYRRLEEMDTRRTASFH